MKKQDQVKQAFLSVKQDINQLKNQIFSLKQQIQQLRDQDNFVNSYLTDLQNFAKQTLSLFKSIKQTQTSIKQTQEITTNSMKLFQHQQKITQNEQKILKNAIKDHISTHKVEKPAFRHITSTHPAHNLPLEGPKQPNLPISTGNGGVSTDRQTDRQTDTSTQKTQEKNTENTQKHTKYTENPENLLKIASKVYFKEQDQQNSFPASSPEDHIEKASLLLEDLDTLKKQIRLKFKRLTQQEFKVFSAIYQLENEQKQVDYPLLSNKLKLSPSSIRDYISRIISKGIPLIKEKINNKQVIIHISADLKKIASLPTILQLREI